MTASEASPSPAIEVFGLSKTFQRAGGERHYALTDVSFTVGAGRTTAVVGESGAGKSTLIRCIAGLEKPTSGRVLVNGKPLVLRRGRTSPLQMVFQNPADALDPMRNVRSSIGEPLRGYSRAARRTRVDELLSSVGINPARGTDRPQAFSGGQLQRIVIARALAPEPEVLLCDEPTSALDVSVQAQILSLLLKLQAEHHFGCVVVTHDLALARVLADEILVLRHGKALYHGTVDELLKPVRALDPYVETLVQAAYETELQTQPCPVDTIIKVS